MVTIEHEFDATVVTVVDDGPLPLREDVVARLFEDRVTIEQWDGASPEPVTVTLSLAQLRDLLASLHLPEGVYRARP